MSKKGAQEFWAKYGAGGVLDGGLWAHDSSLLLHCKARALVPLIKFLYIAFAPHISFSSRVTSLNFKIEVRASVGSLRRSVASMFSALQYSSDVKLLRSS
jgi:hypothetical protein